jgi:hypothetical protein
MELIGRGLLKEMQLTPSVEATFSMLEPLELLDMVSFSFELKSTVNCLAKLNG